MGSTAAGSATELRDYPLEREALERVLRSGIFDRAPNLALILRYVCGRFFAGRLDEIREYNIAVDALGRPPGFDQKRDSIVRVEAHRLRKRLSEYYAGPGSGDELVIRIPAGTYVPQFVRPDQFVSQPDLSNEEPPVSSPPQEVSSVSTPPEVLPLPTPVRRPLRSVWLGLVALALIVPALVYAYVHWRQPAAASPRRPGNAAVVPAPAPADEIRIIAGGQRDRMADHAGDVWMSDRFVTGGEIRDSPPRPIARTLDPSMYLRRREGSFRYDLPARSGSYELRLHFAETVFGETNVAGGGEASRVFGIRINGGPELPMDVLAFAGGANTAYIRVFRDVQPAEDGKVHVQLYPFAKEQPFLNALELIPTTPGRISPIRLLARTTPLTDSQKQQWDPDVFVEGGQLVQRHEPVEGAGPDSELFQSERYGNFTYSIPVDPHGRYTVTLRFAESWFGPGRPGNGGVGSRLFDVYSGGRTLLRRFDVLKEAGGPLRAVSRTFRGLEPTSQGLLVLHFVPIENYALINSIEVVDEGR